MILNLLSQHHHQDQDFFKAYSRIIRIGRRIVITQFRNDISQLPVLPANQNIAATIIILHNVLNTLRVRLATRRVDR